MTIDISKKYLTILLIGTTAAMAIYLGLFLISGGNHIVSYAFCPPRIACFSSGPDVLVYGIILEIIGAALIGLGLSSFAYAPFRRMRGTTISLSTAAGYFLLLIGLVSAIFISSMFFLPVGDMRNGLPVGYPLAISGLATGIILLRRGKGESRL